MHDGGLLSPASGTRDGSLLLAADTVCALKQERGRRANREEGGQSGAQEGWVKSKNGGVILRAGPHKSAQEDED